MSVLLFLPCLLLLSSSQAQYNERDDVPWFRQSQGHLGQLVQLGQSFGQSFGITDQFLNGGIKGKNTYCSGTRQGVATQGICTGIKDCLFAGGSPIGICALIGTCCVIQKSCGNSTNSKVAYFTNPGNNYQGDCSTTVNLFNNNICQIRLDFDEFNIAQPTQATLPTAVPGSSFQCLDDAFTVTNTDSNELGFPHLCGVNTGQHIYIPVNASHGTRSIGLHFRIANRNNTIVNGPVSPTWRVRITQLECAPTSLDYSSLHSVLFSMHQKHKNKKNNNVRTDSALLAPAGCLQYYTESFGTYESFNYNGGAGPYIGNMNYAICFRRQAGICGLRHTGVTFQLNDNRGPLTTSPSVLDLNCTSQGNNSLSNDYLLIPGGIFSGDDSGSPIILVNTPAEYYCGQSLQGRTASTTAPGPLYVAVRTDSIRDTVAEAGFRINYQILNAGCF